MTNKEHEEYLKAKALIELQTLRHIEYEKLLNNLNELETTRREIQLNGFNFIETLKIYSSIKITDLDFAKEKIIQIYDREIELLKIKIENL